MNMISDATMMNLKALVFHHGFVLTVMLPCFGSSSMDGAKCVTNEHEHDFLLVR